VASSTHGDVKNSYEILVEKPEGKRPLGRPSRRMNNIKIEIKQMGSIHPTHDRVQLRALVIVMMSVFHKSEDQLSDYQLMKNFPHLN
jgi:hypothetical protein